MWKKIILAFVLSAMIFPVTSADIIFQQVDESSGIVLDKSPSIDLRDANVVIDALYDVPFLKATFEVYSNEERPVLVRVYLKAGGQECYRNCRRIKVAAEGTIFNINNDNKPGTVSSGSKGVSSFAEVYKTEHGSFAGIEFELLPKQINEIKIFQRITFPFKYYLDSLSTFGRADHEKITIYGNVTAEFNEHYPVRKISYNEQVWEYSNLNTKDEHLKDVLVITKQTVTPFPKPIWENSWFTGVIALVSLSAIAFAFFFILRKNKLLRERENL